MAAAAGSGDGGGCGGFAAVDLSGESLADGTRHVAQQLEQLAAAGVAAALAASRPPPATKSSASQTDVVAAELGEWQAAEAALAEAGAELERCRERAAAAAGRAAATAATADARALGSEAAAGEAQAEDAPPLSEANDEEEASGAAAEEELWKEAADFREELSEIQARSLCLAESEAETTSALRQELAEVERRCRRASGEARALAGDASERRAAEEAVEVLAMCESAEAREEGLEEEKARLAEELGSLRFALKDMKSFQHRRLQDLDAQAKRFEKQRRQLETEQVARSRSESEASAAEVQGTKSTEAQLKRLQQLNGLLTKQVREAQEDRRKQLHERARLFDERARMQRGETEEQAASDANAFHEKLDEMSEVTGALRRSVRHLRDQAQQRQRQVEALTKTAAQTELQLEEADAAHDKLREEEQASERRAEILHWKFRLVEQQLKKPPRRRSQGASRDTGAEASASSESPAGAASAAGASAAGAVASSVAAAAAAGAAGTPKASLQAKASAAACSSAAASAACTSAAQQQPELEPPP